MMGILLSQTLLNQKNFILFQILMFLVLLKACSQHFFFYGQLMQCSPLTQKKNTVNGKNSIKNILCSLSCVQQNYYKYISDSGKMNFDKIHFFYIKKQCSVSILKFLFKKVIILTKLHFYYTKLVYLIILGNKLFFK